MADNGTNKRSTMNDDGVRACLVFGLARPSSMFLLWFIRLGL